MPVVVRTVGRPRARLGAAWARRAGDAMLASLRLGAAELSIVITDEPTMRGLNAQHRGEDHATDVLSFPLWEGAHAFVAMGGRGRAPALLGDVVISVDTAARQAGARGVTLEAEATMLLAHGILHLLGLDHRDRTEERRMTARTDALRSVAPVRAQRPAARRPAGEGSRRRSPPGAT